MKKLNVKFSEEETQFEADIRTQCPLGCMDGMFLGLDATGEDVEELPCPLHHEMYDRNTLA